MDEKMKKIVHSKIFVIALIILLMTLVTLAGTYAWFTWRSTDNTSLTMKIGKLADVTFDTGPDINTSNLAPVFNYTDGEKTTFTINNRSSSQINYSIKLNIESIPVPLRTTSFKYKLFKGNTEVLKGKFSSYKDGDVVTLINNGILDIGEANFTFYLYIDGNEENSLDMMNQNFTASIVVSASEIGGAASTISDLYVNAEKTSVTNNGVTYMYAPSVNLMNDKSGGTTSDEFGNIRYYGSNPNNYIYFNCDAYPETNCEKWRIIGVFDNKLKIIRNESIGNYSWDTSASTVNEGYGINEWSQADLMKLLNPGYESNKDLNNAGEEITVNNSLYWNSESGTCYNEQNNETESCDFTSTGLKNDATRNKIADSLWYLGGNNDEGEVYPNQIYEYERGSNVIANPSDGVIRTTTWTGKVGLIYPSDYGYAVDLSQCNQNIYNYYDETCTSTNWLFNVDYSPCPWILTSYPSHPQAAWFVASGGFAADSVSSYSDVNPTLYLSSGTDIVSGDGSEGNPFRIG